LAQEQHLFASARPCWRSRPIGEFFRERGSSERSMATTADAYLVC